MKSIGIITYHSAYNFGSCLQAYATQKALSNIGYSTSIINYRPQSQYQYYKTFHFGEGLRKALRSSMFIPSYNKYKKRSIRFEEFIQGMDITEEVNEPEDCFRLGERFDVYVSGSDQIWNKHSNELEHVDWSYMNPYLLQFTQGKKISYASSLVNLTLSESEYLRPFLKEFAYISCREDASSKKLASITGRKIETVLDPTLLIDNITWEEEMGELPERLRKNEYVLFYSLQGIRELDPILQKLRSKCKALGYKTVVITPLAPYTSLWAYNAVDAGPREFLRLIHDAAYIVTNSYHGTLFSINFRKNFYSLQPNNSLDSRLREVLSKLGLSNRIYPSIDYIDFSSTINSYDDVGLKLEAYKNKSYDYFIHAIEE